ncbi:SusC/RagA family TonB-linked outer membrane protein [Chitinophaga sp. CC14]|uniref:SusC/RagA family TonB-linked outer membrane protein n=1 Tax=Chitinophaga sp. CC14 TaxID=3029199 RepID=UPI003B76F1DC
MHPISTFKVIFYFGPQRLSSRWKLAFLKVLGAVLLPFTLLFSGSVNGQVRVSLYGHQQDLQTLLKSIEAQTGYHPWYESNTLSKAKKIDIQVTKATLQQALTICFQGQPLSYKIVHHTIVITCDQTQKLQRLNGRVLSDNIPVESASVILKTGKKGTSTNAAGEFNLLNVAAKDTLLVTSVGYEPAEIAVEGQAAITISLIPAIATLDQPVVIGYGKTTTRLNPGSVSRIDERQISQQPSGNILSILEGRIPGLFIQQKTGLTDGGFNLELRGQNSINAGNNPYFVIDQVPIPTESFIQTGNAILGTGNPLAFVNPDDIESVEILKDADATAIYGSQGGAGVILITTKKPKAGKPKICYSSDVGFERAISKMKLLSTAQYLLMRREAFQNDQLLPDSNTDYDLITWDSTRYTDWQKKLFGSTAVRSNNYVSVTGGGKDITYLVSGGYRHQSTVFGNNFSNRKASIMASMNAKTPNSRFTVSLTSILNLDKNILPSIDPTQLALFLPPNAPQPTNPDGSLNWAKGYTNPYVNFWQQYKTTGTNYITNAQLGYTIVKGLKLKISAAMTTTRFNEISTQPVASVNPAYGITTGQSTFSGKNVSTWIVEPQAEYKISTSRARLTFLLGSTLEQSASCSNVILASGYDPESSLQTLRGAAQITNLNTNKSLYRYSAAFARVRYDLLGKYTLDLTGRRDGSSRFAAGRQFATFGAIGMAWLISEENFLKHARKTLAFAKIRASYGYTGSDQIGDNQFLTTWSSVPFPYNNITGLAPTRLSNPVYEWETTRKMETGINLGFLQDRLQLAFSFYHSKSYNQLIKYPVSAVTGFSSIEGNYPITVINRSFEVEFTGTILKTKNLGWTVGLNFTIPTNRLASFPNLNTTIYQDRYKVGKPLSVVAGYQFTGVDKASGTYTFLDINGDGKINYPDDLTWHKSITRNLYGGILNSIHFRKWKLDVFIQFVRQNGYSYLYNNHIYGRLYSPGMASNQPNVVMSRWTTAASATDIEKFTQTTSSQAYDAYLNLAGSDHIICDASYLRLKNVSLSYTTTGKKLKDVGINILSVHLSGQNIAKISKYVGIDPENQNANNSIPPLAAFNLGIDLTFQK